MVGTKFIGDKFGISVGRFCHQQLPGLYINFGHKYLKDDIKMKSPAADVANIIVAKL